MPAISTTLLNGSIQRMQDGIRFQLQSEPIERLFSTLSRDRRCATPRGDTSFGWCGERYVLDCNQNGQPIVLPGFVLGRFDLWGRRELMLNNVPNLSILLAHGLGTGVNITVQTVLSVSGLSTYTESLTQAVQQLYADFMRDRTRTIRIVTEEGIS